MSPSRRFAPKRGSLRRVLQAFHFGADMTEQTLLILTSLPDSASADRIAGVLVESRLAACVSCLAPVRSIYRWNDKVEVVQEIPLMIKTRGDCYRAVEEAIRMHHPYSVPEIIALEIQRGLPAYLRWLVDATDAGGPRYA
jgi:periplasmic divalent cation tolerance protein